MKMPKFNLMKTIRVIGMFLGIAALMSFSSCNTMSGLGEDLQHLGKKMERKGDRNSKDY